MEYSFEKQMHVEGGKIQPKYKLNQKRIIWKPSARCRRYTIRRNQLQYICNVIILMIVQTWSQEVCTLNVTNLAVLVLQNNDISTFIAVPKLY